MKAFSGGPDSHYESPVDLECLRGLLFMQRTVASFALAIMSLLVSYAIVAEWPDRVALEKTAIAEAAPAVAPAEVGASAVLLVGLAD